MADIIRAGVLPVAIEFMDRPCIRACEDFVGAGYPDVEALLIVEVEGSGAEIDMQLGLIKQIASRHLPEVVRESQSEEESARIWAGRKSAFGAMGRLADYVCLDGTIPVSELPVVLKGISELSQTYGLRVANVFHAGDGNLHPLLMFDANSPDELQRCETMGAEILKLCVKSGGCLTGEHGVGVEKRDLMPFQFTPDDLEAQMRVKDVFDPKWLLNPSKGVSSFVNRRTPVGMTPSDESELREAISSARGPLAIAGGGTRPLGKPLQGTVLSGVQDRRYPPIRAAGFDPRRRGRNAAVGG